MTPIHAVLFDCDGTLVDSEDLGNEVLLGLVRRYGIPLSEKDIRLGFRGGRFPDYIAKLESLAGHALPEPFIPEYRSLYRQALATRLQPVDGANALLASLTLPVAVVTNGQRAWTEKHLQVTGLLPYFAGRIFSAHEVGSWKPDPRLYLHAAQTLEKDPAHCAVIEDSLPGIQAGVAAGMQVFAYLPFGVETDLPRGVVAVKNFSELKAYLQ